MLELALFQQPQCDVPNSRPLGLVLIAQFYSLMACICQPDVIIPSLDQDCPLELWGMAAPIKVPPEVGILLPRPEDQVQKLASWGQ